MAKSDPNPLYSITELAHELGVTARAIRFYESRGLLEPQRVGANRVYTHRDRARLLLILRGKRLGFTLSEVQQYLDLYDADPSHKEQLQKLRSGARRRIDDLEAQRRDLDLTLEELREIEEQTLEAMRQAGITPEISSSDLRESEPRRTGQSPQPAPKPT